MSWLKFDYVNKYNITINECKEIDLYSCKYTSLYTKMSHKCKALGEIYYLLLTGKILVQQKNDLGNYL